MARTFQEPDVARRRSRRQAASNDGGIGVKFDTLKTGGSRMSSPRCGTIRLGRRYRRGSRHRQEMTSAGSVVGATESNTMLDISGGNWAFAVQEISAHATS